MFVFLSLDQWPNRANVSMFEHQASKLFSRTGF
jgi:hypothetical protein